jgi:8-amino-7-oxononanoate synthase
MMDAVINEVDGRMIRVGDHWLADFASCNYLGFDLDREIIESIPAYLDAWGTHPSWSRLLGSPVLYEDIEDRLTALLGSEDSLVLPTITHIHMSVIPLLAASGTIFLDSRAHKTVYDGCQVARARGAAVRRFRFEDPDHLDELLRAEADPTRLVCMDGVNSMTGNAPDLPRRAPLRR